MQTQIVIIGSGAAGIQAAIYASRRRVETLVLGKLNDSSLSYAEIENYFGIADKTNGLILLENAKNQAKKFGAKFIEEDVVSVEKSEESFMMELESGRKIIAKAIIIATGVSRKKLNVKGEQKYLGKGVSYCVDCDGMFFRNKDIVITGNGSAACDGAFTLSKITNKVYFVFDKLDKLDIPEKIKQLKNVEIIENQKIREIKGDENLVQSIMLDNGAEISANGIFIELGAKGAFDLFQKFGIQLDKKTFKHIEVDCKQKTSIEGIFAAGDITGAPYQVAIAVGEGAIAGMSAADYEKEFNIQS